MIDAFLHAALMMTTPILLAAIGGLVNRIGGLVNLGLESMMLAGALVAVIVSAKTGSSALATFAALGYGRRRRPRHVPRHHASFRQRGHCRSWLHRRDGGLRALLSEEHLRGFGDLQSAGRRDASAPRHPFPRFGSGAWRDRFGSGRADLACLGCLSRPPRSFCSKPVGV